MLPRRAGSIVNISSIQGVAAFPRYYVYDAAKSGILMATKSIAVDYGPFGIRANAVLPGCIETPMTYTTLPPDLDRDEALRREGELAPLLRVGQPEEVADVVTFLLDRLGLVRQRRRDHRRRRRDGALLPLPADGHHVGIPVRAMDSRRSGDLFL